MTIEMRFQSCVFFKILVFITVSSSFLHAQNVQVGIHPIAKIKNDRVWLRWAPGNATVWSLGNKYGYKIERFKIQADGTLEDPAGVLLAASLKPLPEQEFEKLSGEIEEASVVQELIYGENSKKTYNATNRSSILERTREVENEFGISLLMCDLNRRVAQAAALFWEDQTVLKGMRYIYRISVNFKPANGQPIEPGVVVVDMKPEVPLQKIDDLQIKFGDHKASLQWSTILHRGMYSAYYIERSSDGQNFKRISDLPYVHLSQTPNAEKAFYVDSLELNNKTFSYRINGISPFAEEGPFSNVVAGQGKDDLSGLVVIREGKSTPPKGVFIKWEFPREAENQIFGFVVSRAKIAQGPFVDATKIPLPRNIREFADETSFYNTYYVVKAVGPEGNELSRSFPFLVQIEDTTPPEVPTGLKGVVDQNGIVTLSWNANTDADLLGYRVFQANSRTEEATEITKSVLSEPQFTDTLNINVLTRDAFYKIVAVDKNYNPSEYTSSVRILRPDVVAPAAPVFKKSEVVAGKVVLEWDNAANDDAATLALTRIEKEDRVNRDILAWKSPGFATSYTEPILTLGKTYRYKLTVTDSAGNKSETLSGEIFYETGVRNAVQNLQSSVDREAKVITISWKNDGNVSKCFVYRKKNDGLLTLYKTIDGDVTSFTDRGMTANNTYIYQVQVMYAKGVKSLLSEEHIIKY